MEIKRILGIFLLAIAISIFVYILVFCEKEKEVHFKQECGRIIDKIISHRREEVLVNIAFPSGNETKSYHIKEYFNYNIGDVVCEEKNTIEGEKFENEVIILIIIFTISFIVSFLLLQSELE